jgi:hypothetical protein
VNRDEQSRPTRPRERNAVAERDERVVGARHGDPVLARLFQLVAQRQRKLEDDGLLHLPALRLGAVVDPAVARIDHHHGSRITARFELARVIAPARLRRAVLDRNGAQEGVAIGRDKLEHEPVRLSIGGIERERFFDPGRAAEIDHDARPALHDEAETERLDQPAAGLARLGRKLEGHLRQVDYHPIGIRQRKGAKIDLLAGIDDEAGLRLVAGEPDIAGDGKLGRGAGRRRGRAGALARAGAAQDDRGKDDSEARRAHRHGCARPLAALLPHYGRVVNPRLTGRFRGDFRRCPRRPTPPAGTLPLSDAGPNKRC